MCTFWLVCSITADWWSRMWWRNISVIIWRILSENCSDTGQRGEIAWDKPLTNRAKHLLESWSRCVNYISFCVRPSWWSWRINSTIFEIWREPRPRAGVRRENKSTLCGLPRYRFHFNWMKLINMCLQVVLGLRGSNKIIEDQLDEVLIRNGVENPSKIQLVETEIKEWNYFHISVDFMSVFFQILNTENHDNNWFIL